MERVEPHLFNLDFESVLKKNKYTYPQWQPINGELEHLFFWIKEENQSLFTQKKYDPEYLQYITLLTSVKIKICGPDDTSVDQCRLWWGDVSNESQWNKEKILNSKVNTTEVRRKLGLDHFESIICNNQSELEEAKKKLVENFVIKEEFNFSGKGLFFNTENLKDIFPCVVEPWLRRIRDFSIFISDDDFYISQSQVDNKGTYKGSHIKKTFSEESKLKEAASEIWEHYKKQYDPGFLQIDSFQFLDGQELVLNTLGEINHRKSIGQIYYKIHKKFGSSFSFMAMIPSHLIGKKENFQILLDSFQKYQYNPVTKVGVIALSSGSERFSCFFFTEKSERSLQFLIRDWWKLVIGDKKKLPPEFIVYL